MPPPRRADPEPLEADEVKIVTVGTALWFLALVVALVMHDRLADAGNAGWIWIFLAGGSLGLVGIACMRRRRDAIRRDRRAADGAARPEPTKPLT